MTLGSKTAYITSHADMPIPEPLLPVMVLLEKLNCKFLQFRWSRRKVPHIILQLRTETYSVCYFGNDKFYRVFYPYPSSTQEQHNCQTPEEVIEFIQG